MARKRANLTDLLNELTFRTTYEKYKLIAVNAFEWSGLPEGTEERHIENWLFRNGKVIWFEDPNMGLLCLQCNNSGKINLREDPLGYIAYGVGYQRHVPADRCVIMENNKLRIPTHDFVMMYVNKLTEAERTMDVNVKACKTPVIITCDDKDVLSFKNLFSKVDGNVPAIYADRALNPQSLQALDLRAKFMGNELMDYKHSVENDLLTFLGINNPAVDKKERAVVDEVNSNNQLIQSFFDLQMEARQRACDAINAMFGTAIAVKPRQPVQKAVEYVENGGDGHDELG